MASDSAGGPEPKAPEAAEELTFFYSVQGGVPSPWLAGTDDMPMADLAGAEVEPWVALLSDTD